MFATAILCSLFGIVWCYLVNEVVVWSRSGCLPVKCYIIGWNVFAISTIGWNNLKASEHAYHPVDVNATLVQNPRVGPGICGQSFGIWCWFMTFGRVPQGFPIIFCNPQPGFEPTTSQVGAEARPVELARLF